MTKVKQHDICPLVSFIIVARNASATLPGILSDLVAQDYPKEKTELILIDSMSKDGTAQIMENFSKTCKELIVKILYNSGKILSTGWNVALAVSKGEIIIRVDAHTEIPPNFISKNVKNILDGENIVGGPLTIKVPEKIWSGLPAIVEKSKFGSGISNYKNISLSKYVDTIANAAYKREVFQRVGGYDERLVRHQDNEIHYRMKQAGFDFFFDSEIRSFYIPRSNIFAFLKQKFRNGLWIGITTGIKPKCFSLRHYTPLILMLILIFSYICFKKWTYIPLLTVVISYGLSTLWFSIDAMLKTSLKTNFFCIFMPIIFLLIHLAYGIGTIIGFVIIPFFIFKNTNYIIPWPI